ncbi:Gp15 family bacteriophage protein, partial [Enterococcus faecium]
GNNDNDQESGDTVPEKLYSYSQDAGAIYSSFLADYGIDLLKEKGRMHFITFKTLLFGLSENTHFQRILSIRSRSINGLEGE